jgi:hypothetical protein
MPPQHRQLCAPRPKPAGNAYNSLVDLPDDGTGSIIDGRDGNVDATDDNSAVNAPQSASTTAASPEQLLDSAAQLVQITNLYTTVATSTRDYVQMTSNDMHDLLIEMDDRANTRLEPFYNILEGLLQRMDAVLNDNTELRAAYDASRIETAALKAAVDTLKQKLDEQTATPAPPSPDLMASSTTMEEMMMQLSVVHHDIQDVLEAVRNPPGKRKRRTSNQDAEPTTLTNQRPATNRRRDASLEHNMMHSKHATSATQDALDALKLKYPLRPLTITSTEATTDPPPDSHAVQDTTLPDAPSTAPAENDGWRTVEGKAMQKKRRNDKADNTRAATTANNTPTTKNGGRGKNTHQPRMNTPSAGHHQATYTTQQQ